MKSVTFTVAALPAPADTTAPTTTCSAVSGATYTGPQTFTLSASDAGSGVAGTWYRLDGGALTAGTSIAVTAPASGSTPHTITWYSRDVAGNQEAQKSVTFTVAAAADTTAPTTTCSAVSGATYTGPQTFTLSASDAGSGVAGTWYRLDGGALTAGTSIAVTAPASGSAPHTITWYSRDVAGNQEAQKSVTFTVAAAADTTAPTTTCSAVSGATYTGPQTFTLSASDAGSGVAGTWYRLDGGALTAGTSIAVTAPASGSTPHTITWYSRDVAGNQEAQKSVTFTVAAALAGTTTIQVRTSCSGISGYVWVYWQVLDAGGSPIDGLVFEYDDCGHPATMGTDFVVPSGVGYVIYGEFYEDGGPTIDSAYHTVNASEATPGGTVLWTFH